MLICMQKIDFITHFFLKILQRNSKLVILGNLGMSGHTQLNDNINLKKHLMFICKQKINFICHSFLEILQTCYFGYFEHAWLHTQNGTINLEKSFAFISKQKINFVPHIFLEILQKYCKLVILGTLRMSGNVHPK